MCVSVEISGSDQFWHRLNYTCDETPGSSTTDTISDCLVDCIADSTCYAFIYKQSSSDKCSLMTDCTPTNINETDTGTANWVNITLYIKESCKIILHVILSFYEKWNSCHFMCSENCLSNLLRERVPSYILPSYIINYQIVSIHGNYRYIFQERKFWKPKWPQI